jgi:NTE family protein
VSIGAINGALIAGNPVERRLERLREFWNRVSSGLPWNPLAQLAPLRAGLNRFSALAAATFGVPGFFSPRIPPALFAPDATPEALSIYDTSPLRRTRSFIRSKNLAMPSGRKCWRSIWTAHS